MPIKFQPVQAAAKGGNRSLSIDLYDYVGGFFGVTARDFRRQLKNAGAIDSIQLNVNCPGGDVFEAFAIYNSLLLHPAKVNVRIEGIAASAGSSICMAGDTIEIVSNGYVMIHNPWVNLFGAESGELRKMADLMDSMAKNLARAYRRHSKLSEEEIVSLMAETTWMDSEEALERGFVTSVLEDKVKITASMVKPMAAEYRELPKALRDLLPRKSKSSPPDAETSESNAVCTEPFHHTVAAAEVDLLEASIEAGEI